MNKKEKSLQVRSKTKILAIGDIHGDSGLTKKLARMVKKEKIDLVIMAGDLTFADMPTKNIIKPFEKEKTPVLLIPGNHEPSSTTQEMISVYENAANIHGYSFRHRYVGIFGAGTVDWGIDNSEEGKYIFELLRKGNSELKGLKKKIMVTHMHPRGSESEFSGWQGSSDITKAIHKFHPDILITSHVHEAGGLKEKIGKTTVINVSRKPTIFEI